MRIVVDILLMVPALLWQLTLSAQLQVRGVGLDLVAVMLAGISVVQGWLYGALGGLACGLVMDGVFGQTGCWSLQYMLLGMVVGLLNERLHARQWVLSMLAVGGAYILKELVPMAYLYLAGAQVDFGAAGMKVLVSAAVCMAAYLPVLWGLRRLHRWDVISAPIFNFHGRKW